MIKFLSPEQWFDRGHNIAGGSKNFEGIWMPNYTPSTFIWTPSSAAARTVIAQVRRARTKHKDSTHILLVPRLMTLEWKRQLYRVADLYIELPFDEF